ncbi:CapA family protein [Paraburkholderia sp. BL17N1]|uniref:CapA family protein n=1 Tax=Paraburkholderia sp. BL17N1 TaxID=1938798 RepID=UPI000EAF23A6|nr:CapA family protein [Paraburkholderia sp. BL17N1]RKR45215.1 poly-gamma-glutamate synthesis protein (capsule biosynthesis protein) [Paraburkholderia sp. BL17N1]
MTRLASILIGGDCGPTHGPEQGFPIEGYTELVAPVLREADFRFVNCMRTYSTRGVKSDHAPQVCQPIEMSTLFTGGLFDAVTMANNHSLDAGPQAMLDTRQLFLENGLQVTGAGLDLDEARQPAIVEKAGVRVGYLGYTSVATAGTDAGKGKPGVVNIRVKTTYEPRGPHQPVRVWTSPNPQDLAQLTEDIAALRKQVDVVILAYHAGAIRLPRIVSDYQVDVAHAAIDAGADLVVGHAPHIPKAIEVYRGKVIFYSLGVFAMTKSFAAPAWTNEPAWAQGAVRNFMDLDPDYPLMPYGKDCTLALLAKAYVSSQGVAKVSFLPVRFDGRYRPEALRAGDSRFEEVVEYMEWASEDMPHRFEIEGDEVVVTAP